MILQCVYQWDYIFKSLFVCWFGRLMKEVSRKSIVSCYSEDEIDEGLVKRFSEMPKSKPKNICFDYPVSNLLLALVES